jgi:DNA polymerase/3'-5' exonuclease PolX
MIYDMALPLAEKLQDLLAPACKRIEIAGSIRRLKPEPGDIEIVAIPDLRPPRLHFGMKDCATNLDMILQSLQMDDENGVKLLKSMAGPRYKKYYVSLDAGQTWLIKLDLFLVIPPSDWGVEYLIRTGPAEFSHWIVTKRSWGGGMPDGYRVDGNRVISETGDYIPCPEEIDFLRFCKLQWIEPKFRRPMWQRSVRKIQARELSKI